MKKLLTICLIMAAVFTVNAQVGEPNKEETIAYLNKTLKMSEGYKRYGLSNNQRSDEYLIMDCNFKIEKINYKEKWYLKSKDSYNIIEDTYSKLKWEDVTKIEIRNDERGFLDEDLGFVFITFLNKVQHDSYSEEIGIEMDDDQRFPKLITLYILKNKADNFKKGLERLVEIAKEENKDPFQD